MLRLPQLFLPAILIGMFQGSIHAQDLGTITVKNNSDVLLKDKLIAIKRNELVSILKQDSVSHIQILNKQGKIIPIQKDDEDGDGKWDEFLLLVDLRPKETLTLEVRKQKSPISYEARTNIRFARRPRKGGPVQSIDSDILLPHELPTPGTPTYQMDGVAWENDKVAYRHYFDGRNLRDVFGKRTGALVLDKVGLSESGELKDTYHVLADWGRDVVNGGRSLGVGGIAIKTDSILRLGVWPPAKVNNVDTSLCYVRSRGPIHASLHLIYKGWHTNDTTYNVQQKVSMWPGVYGYKNEITLSGFKGNEELIIGLVNTLNQNPLKEINLSKDWAALTTHDHQSYDREFILGLAIIVPRAQYLGYGEAPKTGGHAVVGTYYARMKPQNKPLSYYVVTGWELSDPKFKTREGFEAYLKEFINQATATVNIKVKSKQ